MNERLPYLFNRFLDKTCSIEEKQELMGMALEENLQKQVQELIVAAAAGTGDGYDMDSVKADALFHLIIKKDTARVVTVVRKRYPQKWGWWAAAIFALLSVGSYFIFFKNKEAVPGIVKIQESQKDIKAPETTRAMITLADGRTVYLDSADNGQLALQGNIKLVKLSNGQIAYLTLSGEVLREIQYNTLSNPRGSKVIDMMLSDGSHVWLNAGSSITYPVVFTANERNVELKGEGYFEIARDPAKKFIVTANGTTTEVLGTHFNVNAYEDEEAIKVTLLEGSVKVSNSTESKVIQPGQQAFIQQAPFGSVQGASVIVHRAVDLDQVMAWKNDWFLMDNTELPVLLRQIGRWYDVDIRYNTLPHRKFGGGISRKLPLSKVLELLESNGIKTKKQNNVITIQP